MAVQQLDAQGCEIPLLNAFLDAQQFRGLSRRSIRAYAYDLLHFARGCFPDPPRPFPQIDESTLLKISIGRLRDFVLATRSSARRPVEFNRLRRGEGKKGFQRERNRRFRYLWAATSAHLPTEGSNRHTFQNLKYFWLGFCRNLESLSRLKTNARTIPRDAAMPD
jgi:hypothetical protein